MINRPLILLDPAAPANVGGAPPPASLNANPGSAAPLAASDSPAPAPAPARSGGEGNPFADQDREIEAALADVPPSETPPPPPAKPTVKPAAPAAKPKVEGIEVLRQDRDRLKTEHSTAQGEVARLQKELADAKKNSEPTAALAQELATAKKEREQLQKELRMARYEKSDAVKAAEKEFAESAAMSKQMIESLEVNREDGTTAPASWDDFTTILATMKPGQALKVLRQQYGENAQLAIQAYWELTKADQKVASVSTADKNGFDARVTSETAARATHAEGFTRMISTVEKDIMEKNPTIFGNDPEDTESNEVFKKGLALAEEATNAQKFNEKSPQQKAVIVANVKLRLAAHPRLILKVGRLTSQLTKAQARISELESGALPPSTRPGGTEKPDGEESWDAELDRLAPNIQQS